MPSRPFTRRQALQNQRFLDALARTGNVRLAARELGVHRSTYIKRRARSAAFAQDWDAALTAAHARFHRSARERPPELLPGTGRGTGRRLVEGVPSPALRTKGGEPTPLRTKGGEPIIVRLKSGRFQLRLAPPGRMTKAAEQAFFRALSASANVRLSAAAAGFAHSSFYARQRRHRAFAREMRLALAMGYERLELAAFAAAMPQSYEDDGWRHNDPPPIPQMTVGQALQLLVLHEKSVRQGWDQAHRRRRRGESDAVYVERLRAMWLTEKDLEAETEALRRAAHYEGNGDWPLPEEPPPPALPALEQVTGWSKARPEPVEGADPKTNVHNPDLALFGGWRIGDWKKAKGKG